MGGQGGSIRDPYKYQRYDDMKNVFGQFDPGMNNSIVAAVYML